MRRLLVWTATLAVSAASFAEAKPKPAAAKTAKVVVKADAATVQHLGQAFRAYDAGDLDAARQHLAKLGEAPLANRDYALWLRGMIALRAGDAAAAKTAFDKLATISGSRFAPQVAWRLADVAWLRGDRDAAAKQYARLPAVANAEEAGDLGTAMFRIAEVKQTAEAYRTLLIAHPSHPLAAEAEAKMLALGGAPLAPSERVERAKQLTTAHLWDQAIQELALVPHDGIPEAVANQRDYWTGTTLYEMRRRYGDAGQLLLGVYPKLGDSAAEAMFHGARALSRADRDDDAIGWYHKVVAAYPSTAYAQEAQFLSGWLEFNRGHYQAAIKPLEDSLAKYPHSKWADDSLWFLAMSHYFLNHWDQARTHLAALAKLRGSLEAGKGSYWLARIDQRLDHKDAAIAGYRETVTKFPFSWYALLSRARLAALGVTIGPFGDGDGKPRGPKLAAAADETLASDELISRADELIVAGLGVDAGQELARGEKAFLGRAKTAEGRAAAFATLLDRYRKAGNYNRPWMLAVSYSGSALDGPPEDDAKRWWENAYPRAYRELVEKYQALGDNPEGYLYSIMRKESGFDPHDLSYADAQGLLQMIPPTTQRVAKTLGIPYDAGKLYEPEFNIKTGSWYIGHLLTKFKKQIPLGAGSFNSGPKPVMKWIDTNGDRELDELVELVPYTQTREYMKKVTENYARYRYLYAHELYEQPLAVDKQHYIVDQLTY
ncbi:MAG TPA: transglycosylase SLT domain-containing protein [Kofleriaceae bacterium]|nr:transglycosylase SLT domain-containing protein [Kofleriaceae bacterium]